MKNVTDNELIVGLLIVVVMGILLGITATSCSECPTQGEVDNWERGTYKMEDMWKACINQLKPLQKQINEEDLHNCEIRIGYGTITKMKLVPREICEKEYEKVKQALEEQPLRMSYGGD